MLECGGGQRGAAEIRVQDHPGRVQDAAQRGAARSVELGSQTCAEVAWLRTGADLLSGPRQHRPRRIDRERIVGRSCELVD